MAARLAWMRAFAPEGTRTDVPGLKVIGSRVEGGEGAGGVAAAGAGDAAGAMDGEMC
jgi:hypothetical protein